MPRANGLSPRLQHHRPGSECALQAPERMFQAVTGALLWAFAPKQPGKPFSLVEFVGLGGKKREQGTVLPSRQIDRYAGDRLRKLRRAT